MKPIFILSILPSILNLGVSLPSWEQDVGDKWDESITDIGDHLTEHEHNLFTRQSNACDKYGAGLCGCYCNYNQYQYYKCSPGYCQCSNDYSPDCYYAYQYSPSGGYPAPNDYHPPQYQNCKDYPYCSERPYKSEGNPNYHGSGSGSGSNGEARAAGVRGLMSVLALVLRAARTLRMDRPPARRMNTHRLGLGLGVAAARRHPVEALDPAVMGTPVEVEARRHLVVVQGPAVVVLPLGAPAHHPEAALEPAEVLAVVELRRRCRWRLFSWRLRLRLQHWKRWCGSGSGSSGSRPSS